MKKRRATNGAEWSVRSGVVRTERVRGRNDPHGAERPVRSGLWSGPSSAEVVLPGSRAESAPGALLRCTLFSGFERI